jgi:hypothetical protein
VGDARAAQSVHRTTADEPDQTGCHEGPRFTSPGPPCRPPPLLASIVSVWAGHSVETSAEPRCDGRGQNFSIVARRQVPTVRKRRTEGNAVAARRAARAGIGTQYNARYAG